MLNVVSFIALIPSDWRLRFEGRSPEFDSQPRSSKGVYVHNVFVNHSRHPQLLYRSKSTKAIFVYVFRRRQNKYQVMLAIIQKEGSGSHFGILLT